jgi:signal transduction histidine kinase
MPGGDGSTLLRDIRSDPALNPKQVVLMTGRPDMVTQRRGMEEGADDFLVKPVGVKELIACVAARFRRASVSWRVEDGMLDRLRSGIPAQLPHEFFTPIAGIIGLAEILRDQKSGLSPEDLPAVYDDLYESALRLNRTVRNYLLILDLDHTLSATSAPIKPLTTVEIERAVSEAVGEALRIHKRREDITLRVLPCRIAVEAPDLARIVEELAHNACKFSRSGTPVEINLTASGVLTVADKGRGMTAEEIAQIGAFHQFDRKKQEQQGLGLGLVLVQKIAARAGATFELTSESGQGTTATVRFHLAQ